ncbi:D-alanine--D-alanyl carrier protein ligase [Streptomyces rimosus subsp. rimosus]
MSPTTRRRARRSRWAARSDGPTCSSWTRSRGRSRRAPTGEICVAGAGLAGGYLADPEQTARSFVDLPLDGTVRRVYRTGDLGFCSVDGTLHYAGRRDRQVKVHGHRIEPGEVEAAAARVPGVLRCAAVPLMEDGRCVGLDRPAYTVRDGREPVSAETVRRTLAERLPEYLVPRELAAVEAFPLTDNGKLDTAALLDLITARTEAARRRADAPGLCDVVDGSAAAHVTAAFAEILRRDPDDVPPDASFFELGGTSLDGARLCVRIGGRTGVPVPASVLIAGPTVRDLAEWIEKRQAEPGESTQPVLTGPLTLLPVQTGFLYEQQLDPSDTSAHCVLLWRVTGAFDPEASPGRRGRRTPAAPVAARPLCLRPPPGGTPGRPGRAGGRTGPRSGRGRDGRAHGRTHRAAPAAGHRLRSKLAVRHGALGGR